MELARTIRKECCYALSAVYWFAGHAAWLLVLGLVRVSGGAGRLANGRHGRLSDGPAAVGVVARTTRRLENADAGRQQQHSRVARASPLHLLGAVHAPVRPSRR